MIDDDTTASVVQLAAIMAHLSLSHYPNSVRAIFGDYSRPYLIPLHEWECSKITSSIGSIISSLHPSDILSTYLHQDKATLQLQGCGHPTRGRRGFAPPLSKCCASWPNFTRTLQVIPSTHTGILVVLPYKDPLQVWAQKADSEHVLPSSFHSNTHKPCMSLGPSKPLLPVMLII